MDWDNRCERFSESVWLGAVSVYAVCVCAVCVCYCLSRVMLFSVLVQSEVGDLYKVRIVPSPA